MLTEKIFKLNSNILGVIRLQTGRRRAITLSKGSVVQVVSGPRTPEDRMVDISCKGQLVTLFVEDLRERSSEISDVTVIGMRAQTLAAKRRDSGV